MKYETSTSRCLEIRWFGTFRVGSKSGERQYMEVAAHKVPKMNKGLVGVLDGCNYKCKDHSGAYPS